MATYLYCCMTCRIWWTYHGNIFVLLYDLSYLAELLLQIVGPDVFNAILSLCYRRHAVNIACTLGSDECWGSNLMKLSGVVKASADILLKNSKETIIVTM